MESSDSALPVGPSAGAEQLGADNNADNRPVLSATGFPRPRAIKYTRDMDRVVLMAVNETGAHVAPHGHSMRAYERAASICRGNTSYQQLRNVSTKSVRDRFRRLILDHHRAERKRRHHHHHSSTANLNAADGDRALRDLLSQMTDAIRNKNTLAPRRSRALKELRRSSTSAAISKKRARRHTSSLQQDHDDDFRDGVHEDDDDDDDDNHRRHRHHHSSSSSDSHDMSDLEPQLVHTKRARHLKHLKLDEERLRIERDNSGILRARLELDRRQCEIAERRLELERTKAEQEKERLNMDRERFELEKEERKSMLGLIQSLILKMN